MFAASANDFTLLFVSVELITVTFYVLTSFQRSRLASLEAGVKYLILGALASAFLVFGIALVFRTTGQMNFDELARSRRSSPRTRLSCLDCCSCWQDWDSRLPRFFADLAPDVYQGSPAPTTAFSRGRLESRGLRSAPAGVVRRRAGHHRALDETAHDNFGDHDSLREPLRHSAAEPETPARILQHIERRLHAPGRSRR